VKTGYQDKIILRKNHNVLRLYYLYTVVLTQLVGNIFNDNRAFFADGGAQYS